MLKKFGMVSAGVTAALLAAAPLASAGESCDDGGHGHGHHNTKGEHDGHGKGKGHHKGGDVRGDSNATCAIGGTKAGRGGEAKGGQEIANSGILGAVSGPISNGGIGGPAVGNVTTLSCNSFLNHSLNDNLSHNSLNVLSEYKAPKL